MSDDKLLFTSVDPLACLEQPSNQHTTTLISFNEKMDTFTKELDSIAEAALSETNPLSAQQDDQERLVIDPLSSPIKLSRPLEKSSGLTRDVRSLQAVTEGVAALVKLCDCSIREAVYAFHACSGNVLSAKQLLENKRGGTAWTAEEDSLLLSRSLRNYYTLLKYRTPEDLKRRIDYFC